MSNRLGMFAPENIRQDLSHALRAMRKNPAFAATAVLTLALGIGGTTALFTVVRSVLLKPLRYPDAGQLVQISGGTTPLRFAEIKASQDCLTALAAFSGRETLNASGGGEPEVLTGVRVSANFLSVLGVTPIVGRSFLPVEDSPAAPAVVLISSELWSRRFQRDPQIAGKTLSLAAIPYTIVGVLPAQFQFPFPGVDAWMTRPDEWPLMPAKSRRLSPFLTVFGRLKPQFTLAQASAEMAVIHAQYRAYHPAMLDATLKTPGELKPLKDQLVEKVRVMLWLLFGATGFVLLATCANMAGIMLARATSRSREFAVRAALGASKARLIGQVLAESIVPACTGGAIGILSAAWSIKAVPLIGPFPIPRASEIQMDWVVLAFAAVLSIGTGLIFGAVPAVDASRPDLMRVLRGSGEGLGENASKRLLFARLNGRNLLVVCQVALSTILLIGAALMLESLARLRGQEVGFNPANLLTLRVSLPATRYDTDRKKARFVEDAVAQVRASPGIESAAAAMFLPMTGYVGAPVQNAAGTLLPLNQRPIATVMVVTPAYFQTLRIPIRRGRDFAALDALQSQRVTMIDESMARRFWPRYPAGQDPLGERLLIGGVNAQPAQIIGIVADVHQNLENSAWPETAYVAFAQEPQALAMLAIRTRGEPLKFSGVAADLVHRLDRDQPVSDVRTMDELIDSAVGQRKLVVSLLGVFAAVAFLLALTGLYGVIAYSVSQRIQEIGIRRALGAQRTDILRLVMGEGLGLTIGGLALGIAGALLLTRVLTSLLFHVSATDPWTFAALSLFFALASAAACYVPARYALRLDAMAALRNE